MFGSLLLLYVWLFENFEIKLWPTFRDERTRLLDNELQQLREIAGSNGWLSTDYTPEQPRVTETKFDVSSMQRSSFLDERTLGTSWHQFSRSRLNIDVANGFSTVSRRIANKSIRRTSGMLRVRVGSCFVRSPSLHTLQTFLPSVELVCQRLTCHASTGYLWCRGTLVFIYRTTDVSAYFARAVRNAPSGSIILIDMLESVAPKQDKVWLADCLSLLWWLFLVSLRI